MDGWPYTYELLDVDRLEVDEGYQRPLTTFVRRITSKFDPALVGTLVVSRRDSGRLIVVDGQTRAAGIRTLAAAGKAVRVVPCLVYTGLTRQDEARLFARLQKERRGIASFHRFRADVVAGEPEAVAIKAIVEGKGYELGEGKKLGAVAALERVYRRGPEVLERTLDVLLAAWGLDYVPSGDLIKGVGRVIDEHGIGPAELAAKLAEVTPGQVKRLALESSEGSASAGSGIEGHVADALEAIYHGYEDELGAPARNCQARTCNAAALRGSKWCGPHTEQARELLEGRRAEAAQAA